MSNSHILSYTTAEISLYKDGSCVCVCVCLFVCLSVISLWRLQCCTVATPDLAFDSTFFRHVVPPSPPPPRAAGGEGEHCNGPGRREKTLLVTIKERSQVK